MMWFEVPSSPVSSYCYSIFIATLERDCEQNIGMGIDSFRRRIKTDIKSHTRF